MASIKQRKSSFSVIYWYLDSAGERKQKWDTLETRKEAKQRKAFIEYYQEKFGYVIVPLEEQFAHQIEDSKKDLEIEKKLCARTLEEISTKQDCEPNINTPIFNLFMQNITQHKLNKTLIKNSFFIKN